MSNVYPPGSVCFSQLEAVAQRAAGAGGAVPANAYRTPISHMAHTFQPHTQAVELRHQLFAWIGLSLLCGCSSLLPSASVNTPATFTSFEQAQVAAERIVPLQTRVGDLKELGFDFQTSANVTVIAYPEIVARLVPHPGVPLDKMDSGIRQCIEVQAECRGYLFRFEREQRRREGGFWLDFLNFRRITHVTGWWFEALVVVKSDLVLFRNVAGQARTDRVERQRNPLGPFQPAGEHAGSSLFT